MTYLPAHLNQLHRIKADGTPGAPWPGRYNGCNCWATAGAMGADFATLGKWKPTPPQIRQLSGATTCPGNVGDIAVALRTHGITVRVPRGGTSWERILARLGAGWAACIATDYDVIPDAKSCQPSFDGDHMLFLPPSAAIGPNGMYYDDPLCDRTKRIDPAILRRAARKCANHIGTAGLIVAFVKQAQQPVPPVDHDARQAAAYAVFADQASSAVAAIPIDQTDADTIAGETAAQQDILATIAAAKEEP
jgi:hypothetical protein